ncbi:ATP-binding protein, partial [Streptomyces beijiangensis]|nr:ATP-binding protein [Streptomyces beijiangensis]
LPALPALPEAGSALGTVTQTLPVEGVASKLQTLPTADGSGNPVSGLLGGLPVGGALPGLPGLGG